MGGNVTVIAFELVELVGSTPEGFSSSLAAQSQGEGNAGNLTIETGRLMVKDGSQISSSTFI